MTLKHAENAARPVKRRKTHVKRGRECSLRILFDPTGDFKAHGRPGAEFTLAEFVAGMVPDEQGVICWPEGMAFLRGKRKYKIVGKTVVNEDGGQVNIQQWNHANHSLVKLKGY